MWILGLSTNQELWATSKYRTKYVESEGKIPALKTSVNVEVVSFVLLLFGFCFPGVTTHCGCIFTAR
jgi:hypothetical protein